MEFRLNIVNKKGDRHLTLSGDSMDELIEKIISWQTMGDFDKSHFDKKGILEKELNSGWYCTKETYGGNNEQQ